MPIFASVFFLIPAQYHLIDVLAYTLVCISMFVCYGKILAVSWRQSRRIEPVNSVSRSSGQTTSLVILPATQNNQSTGTDNAVDSNDKPSTGTGAPLEPTVTSASASVNLAQLRRQKIKSRRRELKAVYLTAAIVGTFVILWFPHVLGRVLESIAYDAVVTSYISRAGGAIGVANLAFTWAIYAAVSKSYRRAYRQMLIRIGCCCCKNARTTESCTL